MRFVDGDGREWDVVISVATVKACRELLDVDLCDLPSDFALLQSMRIDDALIANVLFVSCRKQADERGVSDDQFGELLAGDVMAAAEEALWESLTFFFRGARREQLTKALHLQKEMERAAISQLTPDRETQLIERMEKASARTLDEILRKDISTSGA